MILSSIYERISRKESLLMEGLNSSLSLLLAKHCWKGFGQTFADHGWATCWLRAVSAVVEGWAYGARWPGGVRRMARRESWWHSPNAFGWEKVAPADAEPMCWSGSWVATCFPSKHRAQGEAAARGYGFFINLEVHSLAKLRVSAFQWFEDRASSQVFLSHVTATLSSVAIPKAWESEHAIRSPSFWICGYLQEFCIFLRAEQCPSFSSAVFTSLTSTLDIPLSFQCIVGVLECFRSFWCWTSKSMVFREKVNTENPWIFFQQFEPPETSRKPVWNHSAPVWPDRLKPIWNQSETSETILN